MLIFNRAFLNNRNTYDRCVGLLFSINLQVVLILFSKIIKITKHNTLKNVTKHPVDYREYDKRV